MLRVRIACLALALALTDGSGAFAQSAPAASTDPIVQRRADEKAAKAVYGDALMQAYTARNEKVTAQVTAAVKKASESGADPLVAKRDANAKAMKATQPEYDAAVKKASKDYRTAMAAARKKGAVPMGPVPKG